MTQGSLFEMCVAADHVVRPGEFALTIPGQPFAQPRPRFVIATGRAYDSPVAKQWKGYAASLAIERVQEVPMFAEGPIALFIEARWACPKTEERVKARRPLRWHTKRGDADNVAKAVKDALTGVLWTDDAQVAYLCVLKLIAPQGAPPFVRLTVARMDERHLPGGTP